MFTGLKDLDREILKYLNDLEIPNCFRISKSIYFKVCDDDFLKRRLGKYPNIFKYKDKRESVKLFYSRAVSRIYVMKRDFDFQYYENDFINNYLFSVRSTGATGVTCFINLAKKENSLW